MIVNEEKHTTGRQRIAIFSIATFLVISTFCVYASIVISAGNSSSDSTSLLTDEEQARYEELMQEYQSASAEIADNLSEQYFEEFQTYRERVKSFNAADITDVTWEDLKEGDGAEVDSEDFIDYSAYYIGWLSDETVFDSSFDSFENPTRIDMPLEGTTQLIEGWLRGIQGMKIGGVREISIPSSLGYGAQEQGSIPANSPLKFVIMLIPKAEGAEIPEELETLYNKSMGISA